jgi:hypothetical protein
MNPGIVLVLVLVIVIDLKGGNRSRTRTTRMKMRAYGLLIPAPGSLNGTNGTLPLCF